MAKLVRKRPPLRLRLPNPPAAFLGRERALTRLGELLEQGPAAVIVGSGGFGKTALALTWLSRTPDPDAVLVVRLPPEGPVELLPELLRALGDAEGVRVDHSGLGEDPDSLATAALDLAESRPWTILVEDAHRAPPAALRGLLERLQRYARASRWLFTTRELPADLDPLGLALRLEDLPEPVLEEIARRLEPDAGEEFRRAAVAAAGGSPWRLRQALLAGPETLDALLQPRDPIALPLLRTLAFSRVPVPESALPVPSGSSLLAVLERAGLVERSPGGIRPHDRTRELVPAGEPLLSVTELAAALAKSTESEHVLEALRLHLAGGDVASAGDLLDSRGEELLGAALAPSLLELLDGFRGSAAAERWRLRAVVEVGTVAALARVGEPPGSAPPAERLLWARVLRQRGRIREAFALAGDALAADPDRETRTSAVYLRANLAFALGKLEEVLPELDAPDQAGDPRSLALAAAGYMSLGRFPEAKARAAEAERRLDSLSSMARLDASLDLARVAYESGDMEGATRRLDGGLEALPHPAALQNGRAALRLQLGMLVDQARCGEAAALAAMLFRWVDSSLYVVRYCDAYRRLIAGDRLDRLDEEILSLVPEVLRRGDRDHAWSLSVMRIELALLEGRPRPAFEIPDGPPVTSIPRTLLGTAERESDIRHGLEAAPGGAPGAAPEEQIAVGLEEIVRRLARRDFVAAAASVESTLALTRRHGFGAQELVALGLAAELALVERDSGRAERAAEALSTRAARAGAPRFMADAELVRLCLRPDPAKLEELALARSTSPRAARRAQALLGGDPALDAVDRLVLESSRSSASAIRTVVPSGAAGWTPGWGLDETSSSVWRAGGSSIPLARHPIAHRVLRTLAERGGRVSKEELVVGVWQETEYHPLRHDNRMQSAVRALRELVEDDPSSPLRVVTTEDGYAVGGSFRWRRPHTS